MADDGRTRFDRINEAKYHRSRLVASLTQIPHPWVRKSSQLLTQIAGRQLGILARLRDLNRRSGYKVRTDPALKEEIRRYYQADNARLEARFGVRLDAVCEPAIQSAA